MEIFEFSNVDVYDFRDVQDQLMQHFEALYQEREGTYNKKLEEIAPSRYLELLKKINSKEVVGYFYNDMRKLPAWQAQFTKGAADGDAE